MIAFLDEYRGEFGVESICRLSPIAPPTYYENVAKDPDLDRLSLRARSDFGLEIEIRRVFNENSRSMACERLAAIEAGELRHGSAYRRNWIEGCPLKRTYRNKYSY
ncbi:hypothetical protein At1D132_49460 (plasmid) [Agrobacterium fabrum]|nr:hypothetical protein At1D132_49460 [Agrobacterium fabrum]